jgi:hypothetical protein
MGNDVTQLLTWSTGTRHRDALCRPLYDYVDLACHNALIRYAAAEDSAELTQRMSILD